MTEYDIGDNESVPTAEEESVISKGEPRSGDLDELRTDHLSHESVDWLKENDVSLESIVQAEIIRRENDEIHRILEEAANKSNQRPILVTLYHHNGRATYDDIMEFARCSKRTIKKHVANLRDQEILDVNDGRPATIEYSRPEIEVLVSDVLAEYFPDVE